MYYVIKIDQGDYVQDRGGMDWGRTEYTSCAKVFEKREDAKKFAEAVIPRSIYRGIEYQY